MSNTLAPWTHIKITHNGEIVGRIELTEDERIAATITETRAREIAGMVTHVQDKDSVSLHLMLPSDVCMFIAPYVVIEKILT